MIPNLLWWALFLAALAGVVLAASSLTTFTRAGAVVALVLFTVAGVLALLQGVS